MLGEREARDEAERIGAGQFREWLSLWDKQAEAHRDLFEAVGFLDSAPSPGLLEAARESLRLSREDKELVRYWAGADLDYLFNRLNGKTGGDFHRECFDQAFDLITRAFNDEDVDAPFRQFSAVPKIKGVSSELGKCLSRIHGTIWSDATGPQRGEVRRLPPVQPTPSQLATTDTQTNVARRADVLHDDGVIAFTKANITSLRELSVTNTVVSGFVVELAHSLSASPGVAGAEGPQPSGLFHWGDSTVDGFSRDQIKLLTTLWDSSEEPKAVPVLTVIRNVYVANCSREDKWDALRKLRGRTEERLDGFGVYINLANDHLQLRRQRTAGRK